PMVDVTFLLLIFFMVTASFALQRSIEMPEQLTEAPSTSNQEEQDEVEMVDLEIDERGMFRVITDATEHQPTPSKMAMLVSLKEANTSKGDPMKLNVKVHEDAEVRFLVYGMDAGNQANYSPIIVTQVDGFDE
ncbi:MAG: biopolymer transporter ExbD, partial [Planctomycetota bacterium]